MRQMALIELVDISKSFDGELVLDEFNLKIKENEFITLLGPSGCGKTTTLRILGGFETKISKQWAVHQRTQGKLPQATGVAEQDCPSRAPPLHGH